MHTFGWYMARYVQDAKAKGATVVLLPRWDRELAGRLDCRLEGDGTIVVQRVAGIQEAEPGDLTFFANAKYAAALKGTRVFSVAPFTTRGLRKMRGTSTGKPVRSRAPWR